jgi:DNA-binding MarR family transcriptional regulator
MRLARVFQKVDRAASESLRCRQLSPAQVDVLAKVGSSEGISQQELANALLVTKGNVCQLLDKMEASGLLERRPDGRVNRLFLTDQGRRVHDEVVPRHDELLAAHFNSLSARDQRDLSRLLRHVDKAMERD